MVKKGCRANLFLKGTERFPHVTRAFKGYNVPKSKGFRGEIYRDLRV